MDTGLSVATSAPEATQARSARLAAIEVAKECWGMLVLLAFLLALVPLFRWAGMPFSITWSDLIWKYVSLSLAAIAGAAILSAIQFPRQILIPLFMRYRKSAARSLILAALLILLFELYPIGLAPIFSVIAITILEMNERNACLRDLLGVLPAGFYLFFGILTVFAYNALAVTVRFNPNYDHVLANLDQALLFGHTTQQVVHSFAATVPAWVLGILQRSYLELFAQIGAALVISAVLGGRRYGIRFVSTILVAYLLSVAFFFAFPTHSPYYACPTHSSSALPPMIVNGQLQLMERALARSQGALLPVGPEYYVAFPCMHLAQPLIILWFVRRWKRILGLLIAVDCLLVPSIVLLEWHYVTDLLGGIVVAVAAIAFTEYLERRSNASLTTAGPSTQPV